MKKLTAVLALVSLLFAAPLVCADDHVVSRGAADGRLADAAAERARNIASLDALLATPGADKAAALAGIDISRARQALPGLEQPPRGRRPVAEQEEREQDAQGKFRKTL